MLLFARNRSTFEEPQYYVNDRTVNNPSGSPGALSGPPLVVRLLAGVPLLPVPVRGVHIFELVVPVVTDRVIGPAVLELFPIVLSIVGGVRPVPAGVYGSSPLNPPAMNGTPHIDAAAILAGGGHARLQHKKRNQNSSDQ